MMESERLPQLTEDQRAVLLIAARAMDYPDEALLANLAELEDEAVEIITSIMTQVLIRKALRVLVSSPVIELQERYVETFDRTEASGLYMTSHELGDSRQRGAAMIELKAMIAEAGFELASEELPDYVPMLLEFAALSPDSEQLTQLLRRLGQAIHRIRMSLDDEHPYACLYNCVIDVVFAGEAFVYTDEDLTSRLRERADLEPLPYPLLYQ